MQRFGIYQEENANRRNCDDPLGDLHHDDRDRSEEVQDRLSIVANDCNGHPENLKTNKDYNHI